MRDVVSGARWRAGLVVGPLILLLLIVGGDARGQDRLFSRPARITETEHLILDHPFDIRRYRLDLQPDLNQGTLVARAEIGAISALDGLDGILLNFVGEWSIDAVHLDGQPAAFTHDGTVLAITLAGGRDAGAAFTIAVTYNGRPTADPDHGVPAFGIGENYLYTFSQPFQARYWFPCFDEPSDKAEEGVEIALTVPADFEVAANGAEVSRTAQGNAMRHVWRHEYPISTYLIAVAATNYRRILDDFGEIPLTYYVYPSRLNAALFDFGRHPQMFEAFEAKFGPYPFDRYGVVMTPTRGFAMEHQTMTMVSDNLVTGDRRYESIVAHELAHQWFGDSVTIADYRDIWLNEGFASYGEVIWAEYLGGASARDAYAAGMRTRWLAQDATDRHSLYREDYDIPHLFSRTIYTKGALVLHLLRWELGDDAFFAGLRTYHQRFEYKTVTTTDFVDVMEEVSGRDLGGFFEGWVYGMGFPEFEISSCTWTENGSHRIRVTIRQAQDGDTLYQMHVPVDPDGDGPLPVQRISVDGRWSWIDLSAAGAAGPARIEESSWHTMSVARGDYPAPKITAVENGRLRPGKRSKVRLRGAGFTPASRVQLSSPAARIVKQVVGADGSFIDLVIKADRVTRATRVEVIVLNPDGDSVNRKRALTIPVS